MRFSPQLENISSIPLRKRWHLRLPLKVALQVAWSLRLTLGIPKRQLRALNAHIQRFYDPSVRLQPRTLPAYLLHVLLLPARLMPLHMQPLQDL